MQNNVLIGLITVNIQLVIIAPPGQPSIPTIESSGATWVHISWTAPFVAHSPISYYEIIARVIDSGGIMIAETTTNETFFNVTDLIPNTSYELIVVAVSEEGNITARSAESGFIETSTDITGTTDKLTGSGVVVGGVFGAVCGIILIAILITMGIIFLRKAVRNKAEAEVVHENPVRTGSPQHQNISIKAPDINNLELKQCHAYVKLMLH